MNKIKNKQRDIGKEIRQSIKGRKAKESAIESNFLSLRMLEKALTIHVYISFGTECNTEGIIKKLLTMGKKVIVPIVNKEKNELILSYLPKWSQQTLTRSNFGILEPTEIIKAEPTDIDMAIIPGLLYDRNGGRMGFGGGYYDRLVPLFKTDNDGKRSVPCVAIAYSEQVVNNITMMEHDLRIDHIITDTGHIITDTCHIDCAIDNHSRVNKKHYKANKENLYGSEKD